MPSLRLPLLATLFLALLHSFILASLPAKVLPVTKELGKDSLKSTVIGKLLIYQTAESSTGSHMFIVTTKGPEDEISASYYKISFPANAPESVPKPLTSKQLKKAQQPPKPPKKMAKLLLSFKNGWNGVCARIKKAVTSKKNQVGNAPVVSDHEFWVGDPCQEDVKYWTRVVSQHQFVSANNKVAIYTVSRDDSNRIEIAVQIQREDALYKIKWVQGSKREYPDLTIALTGMVSRGSMPVVLYEIGANVANGAIDDILVSKTPLGSGDVDQDIESLALLAGMVRFDLNFEH